MKRCDNCKKPFKNAHGVTVHKLRNEACGGKKITWGSTRGRVKTIPKRSGTGETGREAIRRILGDHPQGLPLQQISSELKIGGFKLRQGYVSQAAASDPTLVRVERGVYRLKKNAQRPVNAGAAVVQAAVIEAKTGMTHLPREALLLRIETLETQNRALQDAHLSFVRGVFI